MTAAEHLSDRLAVHVVDAHLTYPGWSEGGLSRTMVAEAVSHLRQLGDTVTLTTVEHPYDPDREVQRYLDSDVVILQTPINWFGAPWIFKRYLDDVFNAGLHSKKLLDNDGRTRSDPGRQYGTGGHMHGRGFLLSTTWNAPAEAFGDPDGLLFAGKTVEDLLLGISANYRFVGFEVLDHYSVHDIYRAGNVKSGIEDYGAHLDRQLTGLRSQRIRTARALE